MIEDPRPLVFALAKLGLSHSAIAHSCGLTTPILRLYFRQELIQAATPKTRQPPQHAEDLHIFNNDGEPNDGL